jgi:type VI secretion system protein ImpK
VDRVNWATKDCFNAAGQLARVGARDQVRPDVIHGQLKRYVQDLLKKASEAGFAEADRRAMAYALVALIDETAMTSDGPLREYWAREPLQLALFQDNLAGENFFVELERVRQAGRERIDVLRVFYQCLLLGFQGRYRVRGAEIALADLIESVRAQIVRELPMPEVLAPNGLRPNEGLVARSHAVPLVWISAGLVTLALVLYLGLQVSLRDHVTQFSAWVSRYAGT